MIGRLFTFYFSRFTFFSSRKSACAAVFFFMMLFTAGCDMFEQAVPPEKLPPLPEKCEQLSNEHKNALKLAYTSVGASQMQVARVANEFAQCLQAEGLSRAEAKGFLKKNEVEAKQEAEQGGSRDVYIPQ